MTISGTNSRNDYTAGGASCTFAFTFPITAATSLAVYVCNTLVTNYSVTGVGSASGGTITFSTVPIATSQVSILRAEPYTQGLDLVEHGPLSADAVEGEFDKTAMLDQQLLEKLGRTPQLPPYSLVCNVTLSPPQAGAFVRWSTDCSTLEPAASVNTCALSVPNSFTCGAVVYATGSVSLGQSATTFFWDATSQRLALGTLAPAAARMTVTYSRTGDGGIVLVGSGGGVGAGVNVLGTSTNSPSVTASATAYYAGLFFNITNCGTDALNAQQIGLVGQSVYSNAGYFQQGASSGSGSTLAQNNQYSALYATRVVASLNGFNYTCAVFRIDDTTASSGGLMDVMRQNTCVFQMLNSGAIVSKATGGTGMTIDRGIQLNSAVNNTVTGPSLAVSSNLFRISSGTVGIIFVSQDQGTALATLTNLGCLVLTQYGAGGGCVQMGAADSGGAGFRMLRVVN